MATTQTNGEIGTTSRSPVVFDLALFQPSPLEWTFLREATSEDHEEIRRRVQEAQENMQYPYPCIKLFHFTRLMMAENQAYPNVLSAAQANPNTHFLDLGCCMGTDVRKLAQDGYPPKRIAGCDLQRAFIDTGYTLFADRDTCEITFLASDVFELEFNAEPAACGPSTRAFHETTTLSDLRGRLTHVHAGALFHLFDEETQRALAIRLLKLLLVPPGCVIGDTPATGAIIFGRHQGLEKSGVIDEYMGKERYGHDTASWSEMWHSAFAALYGEAFAAEHVVVDAELRAAGVLGGSKVDWLFWSVKVV
ncbi:hypothetical protein M0805_008411 [Coniferiporia weirii]|nr:hypothetical protein M0805_008411 [Coniferiporia weirii]